MRHLRVPRFMGSAVPFCVVVIVVLAWLAFRGCDGIPLTATQRAAELASLEERQARWDEARHDRRERAGFDLAMYLLSRLAALGLGLAAGLGLISTLTLRGWRWAATVAPVGGLYPLIISKINGAWRVFDANRSPVATAELGGSLVAPGWEVAQLAATAGAQGVQQEQARGYGFLDREPGRAASGGESDERAPIVWPKSVGLMELLQRQGGASLDKVVLGVTPGDGGEWELVNPAMARMVHVGVGASSGWGKSTLLHSILAQFVLAGGVGLALADASGSALGQWRDCDLLQWPLADTPDGITALFVAMGEELDRRAELYGRVGNPGGLRAYNERRGELPALEPLSLVADEANSILRGNAAAREAAEGLAYRGRKFGLWLILSGQRWTKDEIPTGLKNQLSTRLAFRMNSKAQSNNLLMSGDAAGLNVVGRGIAVVPGREKVEFQAPLIGEDEISALLQGHKGARRPAPIMADVTPKKRGFAPARLTSREQDRVSQLGERGWTTTAIMKEIFGPDGKSGPRALAVNQLLGRVGVSGC